MDQKSIVVYLNRKGWMARVIHYDLVARVGEEAIAYSIVRKYLREAQTCRDDAMPLSEEMSRHIDDSDEAIRSALEELPFSSGRQLSRATHLPVTTVYR
jgi:precorrin-2 methylase